MSASGARAAQASAPQAPAPKRTALDVLFDLRGIIALLFTIYGVVCIIWGLAFTDSSELARSGGENVNLWSGVVMAVFAGLMWLWAIARPELPPDDPADDPADAGSPGR